MMAAEADVKKKRKERIEMNERGGRKTNVKLGGENK